MAYYTREEIDQFVEEYIARQKTEDSAYVSAENGAAQAELIKKYERTGRRQFIFNLYMKGGIDEFTLKPSELSTMAKDFGYGKGIYGYGEIPNFNIGEYNAVTKRLNEAMLKKIDGLAPEASADQIIRQAPFLEMLHDNRFSLDERYESVLEQFKKKVDDYFAEIDSLSQGPDKNEKTRETNPKTTSEKVYSGEEKSRQKTPAGREVWLNAEEFNLLRRLTSREEKATNGELLHKAEKAALEIAQKYERQKRTILASKISAAFLKRFVVMAVCNKKINQWKLNEADKQLMLDFISSTIKVKKLDEERAERVKGWIQEAIEGRRAKPGPKERKKISRKETSAREQLVAVISLGTSKAGDFQQEAENEETGSLPETVIPAGRPREDDDRIYDDEDQPQVNPSSKDQTEKSGEDAAVSKDDEATKKKDRQIYSIRSIIEKNFTEEKIAVKPVVSVDKKDVIYDLYPVGKTVDEAPANGQVIFRKPNDAILISEDIHHYIGLVKTLYDNGCRSLKIGDLSDDKEKNLRFKAALVVAGASRGMPVEGLETSEQLEELKAYNPKIELLIEKRKLRQEMKDLRTQLESARKEGKDTAALEAQIQDKIAEGIAKHIEKGSVDPVSSQDRAARLKAAENAGKIANPVQAAVIQKALNRVQGKS